jgi:dTDP-3,4-didehydro-2,6-dideoxy-alpha-D-glucose 3-reductase
MRRIGIGILGCANVAKKRALPAFKQIESVGTICIASRTVEKAKEFATEHGIEYSESYDSLLQRKDIDVIYVPLPIGLHEEWVIKAAKAGKHIICEKSLSNSLDSVRKMIDCCKENKVILFENFMCGYHPQHLKVKETIQNGEIGTVRVLNSYFGFPPLDKNGFRYDFKLGGGSLNDAGAYTIFMSRKIFEQEPISVTCNLNIDSETKVDISGSAFLEFPESKVALVSFGFDNVYQNNYSLWGSQGLIKVGMAFSIPPNLSPSIMLLKNENFQETTTSLLVPPADQFKLIFEDFINLVLYRNKEKEEKHFSDILNQAKVLEAVKISAQENRKVKLSEL